MSVTMNVERSLLFERSDKWRFGPKFDGTRRALLESAPAFGEIVKTIGQEVLKGGAQASIRAAADDRLPKCQRVQLAFSLQQSTPDRFFNSPCGLRAQFLIDAELGRNANSHFGAVLRPILLEAFEAAGLPLRGPGEWSAIDSIDGLSSKVWINELLVIAIVGTWRLQNGKQQLMNPTRMAGDFAPHLDHI